MGELIPISNHRFRLSAGAETSGRIQPGYLATERRRKTADQVASEFECAFVSQDRQVFAEEWLERSFSAETPIFDDCSRADGQSKGPASEMNRVGLFQLLDEVVGAEGGLIAVAIRRAAASRLVSAPRLLRQSPGFGQWRWNCSVSSQVGVGARPR